MDDRDPLGLVGLTIADKYRVEALAGEGGFSSVYRAEHLIWSQPVAIKFFSVLEDAPQELREKMLNDFIQEGKLMSELSSRSAAIVQARDIGKLEREGGKWIPYMVLEWIEGRSLDHILEDEHTAGSPPRSLEQTARLLEPVAVALDVAHRRKVAHRDMKPANIVVMGDGADAEAGVKVLDFGIAKVMADHEQLQKQLELTGQQITAFTPNYGAPEQFSRNYGATGPWTDVYAMALILMEMLRGGERVLGGNTYYELGVSTCDVQRRPTPRALGIQVSEGVEAVFAKALAVQPADRYPNMGAFWSALHREVFPGADTWRSVSQPGLDYDPGTFEASAQSRVGTAPTVPTVPTGTPVAGSLPDPPASGSKGALMAVAAVALIAIGGGAFVAFGGGGSETETPAASSAAPSASSATASASASASSDANPLAPPMNGPCPATMKLINGGSFTMGSDDAGFPLWKPAHKVTIDSFCLDVNEVTVAGYKKCVDAGKCKPAGTSVEFPKADSTSEEDHRKQMADFSEFCNWDSPGRDQHPINCLDWYAADSYCKALDQRLPTEAEWELAARGTDGRKYPWGNDDGDEFYMNAGGAEWKAWLLEHDMPEPGSLTYEGSDKYPGTAPVGRFPRAQTQSGQLDMVGNVWEWTADWYALYKPGDAVNPKGPAAGDRKAIRGGGFNGESVLWLNPAARYHQLATARVHAVGFRCAAALPEAE